VRVDAHARERMLESKPSGVQELPFEPEVAADAVNGVSSDG
jgi:hypothetical protein